MFLQLLNILFKIIVCLIHVCYNICFCDSPEIGESNLGKDTDLKDDDLKDNDLKENSRETPKEGIFSRIQGIASGIWNFPLVKTKFFTVRIGHIVSSALSATAFAAAIHEGINMGIDAGVNSVINESYAPLLKKILVSPHQSFTIINYQLHGDKFLKQAIEVARMMKDKDKTG